VTSTTYENAAAPESDLRRRGIRVGDLVFKAIAVAASVAATVLLGWIAFKVLDLAWPAIQDFGLSFVWTEAWDPVTNQFGALIFVYGTVVTSLIALVLATPLSIAIALFLTEIAPRRLAAPIATMVELLAAIPSVVLGLWGILVFGPWVSNHLEPWIQDTPLGLLPVFSGAPLPGGSIFTAGLVLTIMIIPITSAICRELFIRVPKDLTDGALALGSTRWEAIRGVMFAYAAPGIAAAVLLGLGRAFGEAIAVTQTIGNRQQIPPSWFEPGDSLGSMVASQYQGATSVEQASSILYLAAILMVISLATNLVAQFIVVRFEKARRAV
jgi:phosphate transport system permease protein